MNVESFKGAIRDLARPNRFRVEIARLGNLRFFVKGTDIPSDGVDAIDVPYMGRIIKMPGDRPNPDWTLTVFGAESFETYNLIKAWLAEINHPERNVGFDAPTIKSDGTIVSLGRDDRILNRWKIVGCFPTMLGAIPLDWASNNAPMEFSVTMALDYVLPYGK